MDGARAMDGDPGGHAHAIRYVRRPSRRRRGGRGPRRARRYSLRQHIKKDRPGRAFTIRPGRSLRKKGQLALETTPGRGYSRTGQHLRALRPQLLEFKGMALRRPVTPRAKLGDRAGHGWRSAGPFLHFWCLMQKSGTMPWLGGIRGQGGGRGRATVCGGLRS